MCRKIRDYLNNLNIRGQYEHSFEWVGIRFASAAHTARPPATKSSDWSSPREWYDPFSLSYKTQPEKTYRQAALFGTTATNSVVQ
jgi:hypothetical protein